MSNTVLKAFGLRPEMGAMKLPAAPALEGVNIGCGRGDGRFGLHDIVDGSQLCYAAVCCGFEGIKLRYPSV
jgi:hypothetical protein